MLEKLPRPLLYICTSNMIIIMFVTNGRTTVDCRINWLLRKKKWNFIPVNFMWCDSIGYNLFHLLNEVNNCCFLPHSLSSTPQSNGNYSENDRCLFRKLISPKILLFFCGLCSCGSCDSNWLFSRHHCTRSPRAFTTAARSCTWFIEILIEIYRFTLATRIRSGEIEKWQQSIIIY